jgi:hypothetical protein
VAKAQATGEAGAKQEAAGGLEDLYLLAMPLATYRKLSDIAAQQNMTVAKVLSKAIEDFLGKSEHARLLEEAKKEG